MKTNELLAKELAAARARASQGEPAAVYDLAVRYSEGKSVDKKDAEALRLYYETARQGNTWAMTNIGKMYANGEGVAQDFKRASQWYYLAAILGEAQAQTNLGNLYHNGQGVRQNHEQAADWFQCAAEQGFPQAQCNLGVYYENGFGVAKDPVRAVELYRAAAESGYALAQRNLGDKYEDGEGVAPDNTEALKWFVVAGVQGDTEADSKLNLLKSKMTPAEILEGQQRAAAFLVGRINIVWAGLAARLAAANIQPAIEPPDSFHLLCAQGWCELGLPLDALEDLNRLPSEYQQEAIVIKTKWDAHSASKQWDEAFEAARQLLQLP